METEKIKILIDRFYQGETSHEEEQFLFDYLASDDVASELIDEKPYFMRMRNMSVPSTLRPRIEQLFDDIEKEEKQNRKQRKPLWWQIATVAATLAIAFLIVFHAMERNDTDNTTATITKEEQQALVEALELLSMNWEKGLQQLEEIPHSLDQVNEIITQQ